VLFRSLPQLKKNLIFLLEQRVAKTVLVQEAKSAGVPTEGAADEDVIQALALHVTKSATVPEEDIKKFFDANLAMMGGAPYEEVKEPIQAMLLQEKQQEALNAYEGLGASIHDISLPNSPLSVPVYYVVAPAECSSNLARFDGVRYGHRCTDPKDLADLYQRSRAEGFGAEVQRRIMIGTYVLSAGYYDAYYLKAQQIRHLIADDFRHAYASCDLILGPTAPSAAFRIGAKSDDPVQMYLNDIFTVAANLAGAPAMSIPCGFTHAGLPIGLQLQGDYFSEARLLNVAHQYQQATDWHIQTPA
jgi:aspartyl-tRNA(Asn)/glutamyl-tRNA(Gln) amidotransferase subunit A